MTIDTDKYLTIPFLHEGRGWDGIDCFGLAKLFYATELNVAWPDYHYVEGWQQQNFNYIEDEIWKHFKKIKVFKKYCVATFKHMYGKIDGHMGVMLDEISFLHIIAGSTVMISKLTHPYYKKSFSSFWEYKNGIVNHI